MKVPAQEGRRLPLHGKCGRSTDRLPADVDCDGSGTREPAESGRSGIRTHETLARPTVFKTVAFVRSAILPGGCYLGSQAVSRRLIRLSELSAELTRAGGRGHAGHISNTAVTFRASSRADPFPVPSFSRGMNQTHVPSVPGRIRHVSVVVIAPSFGEIGRKRVGTGAGHGAGGFVTGHPVEIPIEATSPRVSAYVRVNVATSSKSASPGGSATGQAAISGNPHLRGLRQRITRSRA